MCLTASLHSMGVMRLKSSLVIDPALSSYSNDIGAWLYTVQTYLLPSSNVASLSALSRFDKNYAVFTSEGVLGVVLYGINNPKIKDGAQPLTLTLCSAAGAIHLDSCVISANWAPRADFYSPTSQYFTSASLYLFSDQDESSTISKTTFSGNNNFNNDKSDKFITAYSTHERCTVKPV